jgi:hypothetical protein
MTDQSTQDQQQDRQQSTKISLTLQLPKRSGSAVPKDKDKEKKDTGEHNSREYISEIKEGKIIPTQPKENKAPLIIPIYSGWYEPKEKPRPKGM